MLLCKMLTQYILFCFFVFSFLGTDRGSVGSYSHFRSPSLPMQRFHALASMNQNLLNTKTKSNETIHSKHESLDLGEGKDAMTMDSYPSNSDAGRALSHTSSTRSFVTDSQSWSSDQASTSDVVTNRSSESQVALPHFFHLVNSVPQLIMQQKMWCYYYFPFESLIVLSDYQTG